MGNIIVKDLSLSLLQEMGLSYFNIFDIRTTQAFLSAHLQDSLHAKDKKYGDLRKSSKKSYR